MVRFPNLEYIVKRIPLPETQEKVSHKGRDAQSILHVCIPAEILNKEPILKFFTRMTNKRTAYGILFEKTFPDKCCFFSHPTGV